VVTREGKGKPILAVIPGDKEVDLKRLAQAVGEKKVTLPTEREAENLTGLKAGGISPLALINRGFQVLLDSSAQSHPEIYVSGGQRGLNIRLPPLHWLAWLLQNMLKSAVNSTKTQNFMMNIGKMLAQ
jgi:Cys-tRNA(Pro)/Cys-tRNA(Cys) deacylase